jgi:5-formyltetrahydrofolate cyclo-ligase
MSLSLPERQQLRKTMRAKRQQLSATLRQQLSAQILQKIITLPAFQQSKYLAFYLANDGEVDPADILKQALQLKKHCYLPVLHPKIDQHLEFYTYHAGDPLNKNKYGIDEPDRQTQHPIEAINLDLVFLPLVAFDTHGNRLGRGAGYYDRTFAFLLSHAPIKPILIGLAYEFQKTHAIGAAEWDVPVNMVITEKNVYHTK